MFVKIVGPTLHPDHRVISVDPLHIEASIACPDCGLHGFIREGRWVDA